eukprot:6034719-Heterocapsa_arctica.AAC.1
MPEDALPEVEQEGAWATDMTKEQESEIKTWLANGDPTIAAHAKLEGEKDFKHPEVPRTMLAESIQK